MRVSTSAPNDEHVTEFVMREPQDNTYLRTFKHARHKHPKCSALQHQPYTHSAKENKSGKGELGVSKGGRRATGEARESNNRLPSMETLVYLNKTRVVNEGRRETQKGKRSKESKE